MGLLGALQEGKVYEALLTTYSNVTPVGVVRKGGRLFFKLFGGRSSIELRSNPRASIQFTNDVEVLVSLALNFPTNIEFEGKEGYRWIKGLPGVYGTVEAREEEHEDELGKTSVLKCSLMPTGEIPGTPPLTPLSRADFYLLEMGVDVTRFLVAIRRGRSDVAERLRGRILSHYRMYSRLGGNSQIAELILKTVEEASSDSRITPPEEGL